MRLVRILLALVLTGASYIFLLSPWGQDLERLSYDSLFLFRGSRNSPENTVIVAIDESSFDQLDLQWPWPRTIHAELIEKLKSQGASVIAFDLLFAESSSPENDQALANAISNHGQVVLVSELSNTHDQESGMGDMQQLIKPAPLIELTKDNLNLGLANISLDSDGFLRRLHCNQSEMPALSLKIANVFTKKEYQCSSGEELLNFVGPAKSIKTISYYQALDPEGVPKDFFKGKIVLVGFSINSKADLSQGAVDHFPIPFTRAHGGVMPGVEIHANAVENFLNQNFIQELDKNLISYLGLFLGIAFGTILFIVRPQFGSIIFVAILIATFFLCFYLFANHSIYFSLPSSILPLTLCYIASPLFHYLTANKEKAFIKKAFSTYLNPKLVSQLIDSPEKLELGGEEREATVMFADLAGFTSLSETLSPKELVTFVNKYLGAFAEVILKHDGMIDKYIGDCIMAVWGVPLYDSKHAEKACSAALAMKLKLRELNKETGKEISFRIGIASGQVLAGNVGGGTQFNYTVLGNDVNLASRIESLNKFYGTMLMINERAKNALSSDFYVREIDLVKVKGQEQPETLHEIIEKERKEEFDNGIELFNQAKAFYAEKKWDKARECFEKVHKYIPDDGPSRVLIKRCEEYIKTPPPADWDGVFVMTEK